MTEQDADPLDDVRCRVDYPFGVRPGWVPIIAELNRKLVDRFPDIRYIEIMPRFGTLCFNVGGRWQQDTADLVQEAMRVAERTCEMCGSPGESRTRHMRDEVLCQDCVAVDCGG